MPTYKDFTSKLLYDPDNKMYYGRVENIPALIMYEGDTIENAVKDFELAVDEYLESVST